MEKRDISNLPTREKLERVISELKNCNLSRVSYTKVFHKIMNEIQIIPFVTATLKKGHHIERARINRPDEIFYSEKEISYRTDFDNIKKFGRANFPGQSLFYGAIKSDHIEYPRIVNLVESSEIFRNNPLTSEGEFNMTVGKWRIKKDINVVEVVFNKDNIENIPQVKKAYEYHTANFHTEYPERAKDLEFLLEFFSNEFAKKDIKTDDDYKISTAYTEMAINFNQQFHGIVYPSVRSDYMGTNVALTIPAVEEFLELEVVAMFTVTKKGEQSFINNLAHTSSLGSLNSEFIWEKSDGLDEDYINKEIFK